MKFSATPLVIDSETGEQWIYGVAGCVEETSFDLWQSVVPQQEYTLLQLEVLSGIALKYATRELSLSPGWAV